MRDAHASLIEQGGTAGVREIVADSWLPPRTPPRAARASTSSRCSTSTAWDLVINGNNHIYERNNPLIGGSQTSTAPIGSTITPATQGTTYVVAGGAGESLYKFGAPDSYEGDVTNDASISSYVNEASGEVAETVTWSEVRYTGYNLLVVDSAPASYPSGPGRIDPEPPEFGVIVPWPPGGRPAVGRCGVDDHEAGAMVATMLICLAVVVHGRRI